MTRGRGGGFQEAKISKASRIEAWPVQEAQVLQWSSTGNSEELGAE